MIHKVLSSNFQLNELKENNKENKIIELTKAYNESYKLFLNGIQSLIYMNSLLEKIVKIFGGSSGFIAKYVINKEENYLIIDAICNVKYLLYNEDNMFDNSTFNINQIGDNCKICIIEKRIIKVINNNISESDFIFSFNSIDTIYYLPLIFAGNIIGVIGISYIKSEITELTNFLDIELANIMTNYVATLLHNYSTMKISSYEINRNFVTYHLTEEILNTIRDGIIVTDRKFSIMYINDYALSIIKTVYPENIELSMEKNIMKIFPQLEILNSNEKNDLIFKKRKIAIDIININTKNLTTSINFIIDTINCSNMFYHVINFSIKNNSAKNETTKSNKNLIAYLSHELRNPLQTINLANHLIQSQSKKIDVNTKILYNLETINKASLNMKKIIDDILDLSKLEAKEFVLDLEIVNIKDIIDDLISDNIQKAILKNLILEYNISDDVPKTLFTDPIRCKQVLGNLITNSIKYSEIGTIVINIIYNEDQHGILFTISDEGMGIKEDEISKLFKEYGQTSNSFKINADSNGLGLCISQKIANLLGGYITVKSIHQKGSEFTLFLPIKLGSSGTIYNNNIIEYNLSGKILLVDDNDANLMLFKMLLENFNLEFGFSLITESVIDGKDAIELCKINNYDLIFMDINMNGIDGCTASKIIKLSNNKVPIIATTGNILAKKENRNPGDNTYSYFDDVILKPFDNEILLNILKRYLSNNKNFFE